MKFLLDVHLGTSLASLLETQGHSCRLVADVADPRSKDEDILELAFKNQEVVLTHDLDFGKLLAFSKQERPSVIIFRIEKISSVVFYQLLMNNWDELNGPLNEGALVIIEPHSIRIRKLPF